MKRVRFMSKPFGALFIARRVQAALKEKTAIAS
jgi:hypothetical protein